MTCVRVAGARRDKPSWLCLDDDTLAVKNPDCPNASQHEPWPRGYGAASEYAEKMMETHNQSQCPSCGLWLIWTPKEDS